MSGHNFWQDVVPWVRNPFSDIIPVLSNSQWFGKCARQEMSLLDCAEAYGVHQVRTKCSDLFKDYKECTQSYMQRRRTYEMMVERERQYKAGERTRENRYAPPPKIDSF